MEADEIAPLGTGGNDRGAGQLNTDQDQRHLSRGRTQALPVLHKREDVGNPEDIGERFTCGWVRACPRATTADGGGAGASRLRNGAASPNGTWVRWHREIV